MVDNNTTQVNDEPCQNDILTKLFGNVVSSYTRTDALEDGFLVDVSEMATETGFKFPTAVTRSVWDNYIEWTEEDSKRQTYQDQSGRLWDVLWMAFVAIKTSKQNTNPTKLYKLHCVPRGGQKRKAREITLKMIVGPGDQGEGVITIMMPNED